jgi:MraZ protein
MTTRDARIALMLTGPFLCLGCVFLIPIFRRPVPSPDLPALVRSTVPPNWSEPAVEAAVIAPSIEPEESVVPLPLWHSQEDLDCGNCSSTTFLWPQVSRNQPKELENKYKNIAPPSLGGMTELKSDLAPTAARTEALPLQQPMEESPPSSPPKMAFRVGNDPPMPLPIPEPLSQPIQQAVALERLPEVRTEAAARTRPLPLTGMFTVTLNEERSFNLPPGLRKQLGEATVLVSPGTEACVWLTTSGHVERINDRLEQAHLRDKDVKVFRRLYFAQSEKVTANGDGRLVLPERLVHFAGLEGDVVVVGADDHFELWDAARWKRQMALELKDE